MKGCCAEAKRGNIYCRETEKIRVELARRKLGDMQEWVADGGLNGGHMVEGRGWNRGKG
jgi:hypothetical protein